MSFIVKIIMINDQLLRFARSLSGDPSEDSPLKGGGVTIRPALFLI